METTVQTSTVKTFSVEPFNELQASLVYFDWHYQGIKTENLRFRIESTDGSQTVYIID